MDELISKETKYDLVFVTTYIDNNHINDLVQCVLHFNTTLSLLFILVEQGNSNFIVKIPDNNITTIKKIKVSKIIGLSEARNNALVYLNDAKIEFDHIMFPDDDSTFSEDFFTYYKTIVKETECYLIDVFFLGTKKQYRPNLLLDSQKLNKKDFSNAMSVNLLICKSILIRVGLFDEKMGVGAIYGAAEDSDFYLRCLEHGADFYYSKKLFNFHPHYEAKYNNLSISKLCKRFKSYGMGVEYLYCKHKMYYSAILLLFRALGGAAFNLVRCRVSLSIAYIYSFYYRLIIFCKNI